MAGLMKRMFRGMETPAEEKKEAKALKSGKITPKQYVAGEKSEGHGAGAAKKAAAIKSGKLSPAKYAKEHASKKMAGGGCTGKPKKMALGGMPARDIGVGSGPRGAGPTGPVDSKKLGAIKSMVAGVPAVMSAGKPVNQQIKAVRSGPSLSGPLGAAVSGMNNAVNSGSPFKKPLPGGGTFSKSVDLSGLGQAVAKGMNTMAGNQAAQNAAASQARAPNPPAGPFKKGGKVKSKSSYSSGGGVEAKGKTAGKTVKMAKGGCVMKPKKMAKGGGVESKGKTKGRMC